MKHYFIILIILFSSINLSSAVVFSPNDIEWDTAVTGKIYKGQSLSNAPYMVKATQFPSPVPGVKDINNNIIPETSVSPMVYLEIYKDGVIINEQIMYPGSGTYTDPDYEGQISATGFTTTNSKEWVYEYYKPWAEVSIQKRAKPKIEVTVTTNKGSYTSYEDNTITATVTVKNTGKAFVKNVDVNLDLGELSLRGGGTDQLHHNYNKIEKGATESFEVILVVPKLNDEKSYSLSVDGKGYDVKELEYSATGSKSLTVSPKQNYFSISKSVSKDRIYLSNTIIVTVKASNGGMYDIRNIQINDSMNENFELKSNISFQHDIALLKPGKEWGTTYSIKPLVANLDGFSIPTASAKFTVNNKHYTATSTSPKVVVNGPKIILSKTIDKSTVNITEDVTVTVTIKNEGNIATKADVKDFLPESVSLVSGSTSLDAIFLELNTPQGFSYVIRMNKEGTFELPPTVANYTGVEYRGITRSSVNSNILNVSVIDPSRIPPPPAKTQVSPEPGESNQNTPEQESTSTPEPTPTPITPGFNVMFAIIVLIFASRKRI